MEDWIKAGKIASEARKYGYSLIKVGASIKEVQDKIEAFIEEKNAIPAFPAQISLNSLAAHYTSTSEDKTLFKEGDLAKLDLGVCINGAIADTAITKDLGNNKKLVEASKAAFTEAAKLAKPGTELREIGKVIEETITSYGFNPIRNLSGHGLGEYQIHTGNTIPNFDNGDKTKLKENQTIAIEPFATTGDGLIKEGKPSTIYMLVNSKPVRSPTSRKVLAHILEKYKTLPFCTRQLNKAFSPVQVTLAIRDLEKVGNLHHFTQLPEKSNGLVSQHEHTIIVKEKPIITTL
jgi:methionyl aminopeptidase